jgi:hypothetical protein
VVVATEWPAFRELTADRLVDGAGAARGGRLLVLDPNRFLAANLAADARLLYAAVGAPARATE